MMCFVFKDQPNTQRRLVRQVRLMNELLNGSPSAPVQHHKTEFTEFFASACMGHISEKTCFNNGMLARRDVHRV